MSDLWYVRRLEHVKGPFRRSIVERLVAAGRIHGSDELSTDRRQWRRLEAVAAELGFAELPAPSSSACAGSALGGTSVASAREAGVASADPQTANKGGRAPSSERRSSTRPTGGGAAAPVVPRRRRSPRLGPEDGPFGRLKQIASLASVMAVIVVAGLAFMPPPEKASPDCDASAAPGVNWTNCRFESRGLEGAELQGATLRGTQLQEANLFGARLEQSDLAFAELTGANLAYGDLHEASMVGTDLRDADLVYADLRHADLSYADLSGANLAGVDLRGARLDHAIWVDQRRCLEGSFGGCKVPTARPSGRGSSSP